MTAFAGWLFWKSTSFPRLRTFVALLQHTSTTYVLFSRKERLVHQPLVTFSSIFFSQLFIMFIMWWHEPLGQVINLKHFFFYCYPVLAWIEQVFKRSHFLGNLEQVFSLLSFNKENLHSSTFHVGFLNLWPLPRSSCWFSMTSWLLTISDSIALNCSRWCRSSGRLNIFFFLLPLTPLCNNLTSPSVPVLVCLTSYNDILFTSSVSFSRYSVYSIFDDSLKMENSQRTILPSLIIFSFQTAVNLYKKILKENSYTN